jgi:trimeric autotransporter adhesin
MKRIIIAFGLILTGLALFGQSPRIRLNQITKDSVVGSIVLSSLNDSNMVYSRDFYIGADTSLIFYGTTIIAGGGGGGSFVTLPQLEDSLSNYINNETLSDSLLNYINSLTLSDSLTNYILKTAAFGGDVSGTYDNITVSDDSHNHTISTLTGLQDSLNSRLTIVSIGVGLSGSGTTGSPLVVDTNTIATRAYADGVAGGGGTVTSVAVEAGTGITVSGSPITTSGTITVTNAAPDQTVVLTAGTGITTSGTYPNFTITNSAPDQTVSITGAGINAVTGTYPNFTITGTEVDGSVTNEGSLSVGAGGDNSSTIQSNTSGSTPVTIAGGSNVTVTESGSTITIASTGGGASFNNLTETADTVFVAKYLNVDTATLYVDAQLNRVGIGTTTPSVALEVVGSGLNITQTGSVSAMRLNRTDGKIIAASAGLLGGGFFYDSTGTFSISATSRSTIESNSISGSAIIRLSSTQNVGIKATDPVYDLDVNGDVRADTYYYDVGSSLVSSSDARLKKNISEMQSALDKIISLNLVKYEWNDLMNKKLEGRSSQSKIGGIFEGMIAQEVESIFPQYVGEDADGYKTLSYVSFIVPIIKAIQEQQTIINQQQNQINELLQRIIQLENK